MSSEEKQIVSTLNGTIRAYQKFLKGLLKFSNGSKDLREGVEDLIGLLETLKDLKTRAKDGKLESVKHIHTVCARLQDRARELLEYKESIDKDTITYMNNFNKEWGYLATYIERIDAVSE